MCRVYQRQFAGNVPLFIGCSATIANPMAHFANLTGFSATDGGVTLIDSQSDGSPSAEKTFVFWQPPLVSNANVIDL